MYINIIEILRIVLRTMLHINIKISFIPSIVMIILSFHMDGLRNEMIFWWEFVRISPHNRQQILIINESN